MIIGRCNGLPVIDKNTELDMVKAMDRQAITNAAYCWGSWKSAFCATWLKRRGLPETVIGINGVKYGRFDEC